MAAWRYEISLLVLKKHFTRSLRSLVKYFSMTSRFPPFAFVEMVSPYNKKNITRWREDMNFMFEWQATREKIFSQQMGNLN